MGRKFIFDHLTWNWKGITYFLGALAFIVGHVSWKLGIIYFQGNHCTYFKTINQRVHIILSRHIEKLAAKIKGNNSLGYSLYQVWQLLSKGIKRYWADTTWFTGRCIAICILWFEKPIWRLASSSVVKLYKKRCEYYPKKKAYTKRENVNLLVISVQLTIFF